MGTLIAYQIGNCAEICKTYQKRPFFVFLSKPSENRVFYLCTLLYCAFAGCYSCTGPLNAPTDPCTYDPFPPADGKKMYQ